MLRTNIVTIGNSKGVRIPRPLLEKSRLGRDVLLLVKRGEIRIVPAKPAAAPLVIASESTLSKDWNRPEEDAAWSNL